MALATLNTDAGSTLKWLPGAVALPLPDNGQQIQWGNTVQQLGRGAFKLSLDGGTGNANIPGALSVGFGTGRITAGTSGNAGQICGVSVDHAILLRGDTTTADMNYAITPGDTCCFIEYGGRWVFRMINPGLNLNLFEINTGNVFYKSVALQRIPYVSCRVFGTTVLNSTGQVTPSVSSSLSGYRTVAMTPPHPAGANMTPMATLTSAGRIVATPPTTGSSVEIIPYNVADSAANIDFYLLIF